MKKLLISVALICLSVSAVSAKKWTNNIASGITYQNSYLGYKDADVYQKSGGLQLSYIGVHENGFTAKAAFNVGLAFSNDIDLQEADLNIGAYASYILGAGYSFIDGDNALMGFTANVGLDTYEYTFTDSIYSGGVRTKRESELSTIMVSLGLDLFVRVKSSEHFGYYASVGVRYLPAGFVTSTYEEETGTGSSAVKNEYSDEDTLSGKYLIEPAIGIVWTF